jgi:predicted negative regulator of RcsB-dependent stress response
MKNFIEVSKTEDEQVEQIKKWLKENGMQIVTGVALGFAAIWGWGYYQNYQKERSIQARTYYLSVASSPDNLSAFEELQNNYSGSDYTNQASLMMAKHSVDQGNYKQGLDFLLPLWSSDNEFVSHASRIRSASIYLHLKDFDSAISALDTIDEGTFKGIYSSTRGDIYLENGDIDLAKQQYQQALNNISSDSNLNNLIKIKLNDLN